jgi:hypothetical protein
MVAGETCQRPTRTYKQVLTGQSDNARQRLLYAVWMCLACPVVAGLSIGICGCGGATRSTPAKRLSAKTAYVIGDDDDDDRHPGREESDFDDGYVRQWGWPGTVADGQAIRPVLRGYYAAAAAGDGVGACGFLIRGIATAAKLDVRRLLPEGYRPAGGSSVLEGKNCAQVESLLFAIDRQQLQIESTTMTVSRLRISGQLALVVMRFEQIPERVMTLRRERGAWKIDSLIDSELL